MKQILVNLVGNAIKFTDAGEVRLSVFTDGVRKDMGEFHFVVSDTGIGIPEKKQRTVFDVFAQADGSTTRRYGGTGLGLAICSQLVAAMGGRIWVESEEGKGSDFHVVLPLKLGEASARRLRLAAPSELEGMKALVVDDDPKSRRKHAARPVTEHSIPEEKQRLRVLLAEDNPVNRTVVARTLMKRGHDVTAVEDGKRAVSAFADGEFDVVLMDLQMPGLDGFEATAVIRKKEAESEGHVSIVALTAHARKGDRERCLEAGMDDYLTKPFKPMELIRAVEARADKPRKNVTSKRRSSVLNTRTLLERVDGDQDLARELVELFLRDAPALLGEIRKGLSAGDTRSVNKSAHRLRGTLVTLGAEAALEPVARLEMVSREARLELAEEAFVELEAELGRLGSELELLTSKA